MLELLDVTVSLTKDLIPKTSMFNAKARRYLSFAQSMTSGGKKYERPE
jgi:hypothetical protein